jgi:hypothetical protein
MNSVTQTLRTCWTIRTDTYLVSFFRSIFKLFKLTCLSYDRRIYFSIVTNSFIFLQKFFESNDLARTIQKRVDDGERRMTCSKDRDFAVSVSLTDFSDSFDVSVTFQNLVRAINATRILQGICRPKIMGNILFRPTGHYDPFRFENYFVIWVDNGVNLRQPVDFIVSCDLLNFNGFMFSIEYFLFILLINVIEHLITSIT